MVLGVEGGGGGGRRWGEENDLADERKGVHSVGGWEDNGLETKRKGVRLGRWKGNKIEVVVEGEGEREGKLT